MHYFYIIYSEKIDHYYIGETMDVDRRLIEHNSGVFRGCFTRRSDGIITKTWGLGINFSKSKKKKVNISNSSKLRSECFDFSIERFSGSIGRSIIEVVQNCSVVIHDSEWR